jgi:signal transduction histidine kinase/DNA-binding response OmpR family regulator
MWKCVENRKTVVLDVVCLRKDQSTLPATVNVFNVFDAARKTPCLAFCLHERSARLISEEELRTAEIRLARAERLETASAVAGQIAHDFNNLLTPLIAYPQLLRKELPEGAPGREYLDLIEKTATDICHLTQQLLLLSRRGIAVPEVFYVHEVIEQVLNVFKPVLPPGIQVVFERSPKLLQIKGSQEQMQRLIQHLCQNAIEAMGQSGILKIKTENVYVDSPLGQYADFKPGEYVKIRVADTGPGIPDPIKEKIFDPFFSTKKATHQRGSGLGLSIAHGIVKDHGGYIDLETAVGRGTTFFVHIPIHRAETAQAEAAPEQALRKETILVVDDDPVQVKVVGSYLARLGYQFAGARSGEEALQMLGAPGAHFDLIILDMVFDAGMDGLETFMAIRKDNPQQRVMLMSGYPQTSQKVALAQNLGAGHYLKKPLAFEKVAEAIEKELSRPAEGETAPMPENPRILVVDDNKMIRNLFAIIISSEYPQATIDEANDGDEAVRMFKAQPYDAIIMDLQMQRMSGLEAFEAVQKISREKGWSEPSVIFCTGFLPPEKVNEVLRAEDLIKALRESL